MLVFGTKAPRLNAMHFFAVHMRFFLLITDTPLAGKYSKTMRKQKDKPMTVIEMAHLGGLARARALTSKQRTAIAKHAIAARWAKRTNKKRSDQ
jgi:hypothetical protein